MTSSEIVGDLVVRAIRRPDAGIASTLAVAFDEPVSGAEGFNFGFHFGFMLPEVLSLGRLVCALVGYSSLIIPSSDV